MVDNTAEELRLASTRDLVAELERRRAQVVAECTGLSASWCPLHGDCTCDREIELGNDRCSLHGSQSNHAEPDKLLVPEATEHVLCSAVHIEDGVAYVHQPTPTGLVFCHYRHNQIFAQLVITYGEGRDRTRETQGFLTSSGQFVDRVEARRIARLAGQIGEVTHKATELFSEDLWG